MRQRTQEIGIRLALGADPRNVRNLIVGQGMRLSLTGVATGAASALALSRVMSSFLFGVKSEDPLVFLVSPLVMTGTALFAVWLAARKASQTDPVVALRRD